MIGSAMVVATAMSLFHCVPYWPMNLLSATVTGCTFSLVLSDNANRNSPHEKRNANTATVISPGRTNGSTTRQNALNWLQPSILAAASSSLGTVKKNGRRMITAKGSVIVVSARISAG